MKKYPKYKASNVEWIGQIPSDWKIKQLKHLAEVMPSNVDKKSQEDEQKVFLCNYVDVYKNNFITSDLNFMEATASDAQIEKFTLQKGDVIATKDSEDTNDIAIPALVKENIKDVVCGYHLTLMRSNRKEIIGEYLYWLINSKNYNHYFSLEANGVTRYGIGTYSFKNVSVVFPKIDEQNQIAKYLDYKTNQIEILIANKQKLIELLQEERTAIINHAVTKGINPKAKLKPSGIEWLGDVPEDWEVKSLKYLINKKIDNRGKTPPFGDEGRPMLEVKQIENDKMFPSTSFEKFVSPEVLKDYVRDEVCEGDVLIATVGATAGKCCLVPKDSDFFIAQNVIGFRCKKNIYNLFFYYMIESSYFKDSLFSINKSNTIDNLKVSVFVNNKCVVPSYDEQKIIANFIENALNKSVKLEQKIIQEIELMKEYKTALISEVVTGKVDVRDEVIG